MLTKIIEMTRKNPVLILLYLIYMAFTIGMVFLLLPGSFDQTDLVALLLASVKMLIYGVLMAAASLLFLAGYGNMLSSAAAGEKASWSGFASGIRKYILKLLLAGLLLIAILIAYSFVLAILMIPLAFIMTLNPSGGASAVSSSLSVVTTVITFLPAIFLMPFIVLWLPALFTDGTKLTETLRNGIRTGTRCYGRLLLWTILLYLPSTAYMLFNYNTVQPDNLFTPSYIAVTVVSVVLSFLYLCMLFLLYREKYVSNPYSYYPRQGL